MASTFGAVQLAHEFLAAQVKPGDICIDCTAGRGNDTVFLCSLVGDKGKVFSFDIQQEAVESTLKLVKERGFSQTAEVICRGHEEVDLYAEEGTVAAAVFNLGWLPGGDHSVHTQAGTTIKSIEKCLRLLKYGGVISLSIYYGRDTGFEEKEAVLEYISKLPTAEYTVIVSEFVNRPNCPPIAVRIYKC
ncbi:class I SAM-dependent methyltransferase [Ruminococcus sp. Marseille-P6503]|uniref:class I SAM-dependent methyltransferase n=1 Tax=Ruminococcus sp. Marseille-P6503 TaxID=2364796 RepID=UPI000F52C2B3|nr:class I SAM-dependent methyltransferase [Ruminococcus sp. Marseille-P6503]